MIMQKDKTLQFWDDFYRSEQSKVESATATNAANTIKEWIVQPSDELFRLILNDLFHSSRIDDHSNEDIYEDDTTTYKVLEIGCGTSLLSDSMCKYWEHHVATTAKKLHVIATDVSPVCIEQQIQLQQKQQKKMQEKNQRINGDCPTKTKLEYQLLNITELHPELTSQFNMILDKGCFDTCLFRSKNTGNWIDTVLCNLHSWLKVNGVYTIITPRSKIKHVRDYIGFINNVTRTTLRESQYGCGDLEPRSGNGEKVVMKEARQYMYTCCRRQMATEEVTNSFVGVQQQNRNDNTAIDNSDAIVAFQDICTKCGVKYDSFCSMKGSKGCSTDTTTGNWNRRWRGHLQHCKKGSITTGNIIDES